MEIRAMKDGLRPRDPTLVAEIFSKRMTRANAETGSLARMRELKKIAADFESLRDVGNVMASAAELERQQDVAAALTAERVDEARELRLQREAESLMRQLSWPERADAALVGVKLFVGSLLEIARRQADSSERRIARRVLADLRAARRGVPNQQYQDWMADIQLPTTPAPH